MTTTTKKGRNPAKDATPTTTQHHSAPVRLVHLQHGIPVTDSVAISREFRRPHKNVLASVDSLVKDGSISRLDFKPRDYIDERGKTQRSIELTERGALIAMPFVGGRNSRLGQVRLVDAFMKLREESVRHGSITWSDTRKQVAVSYRLMSDAIEVTRADDGKVTEARHFMTEARLVNWVLTGHFASLDRDSLSQPDLALLEALEARNAILIARGRTYTERKAALPRFAQDWQDSHRPKIAATAGHLLGGI